jgi:hypothetical protein
MSRSRVLLRSRLSRSLLLVRGEEVCYKLALK